MAQPKWKSAEAKQKAKRNGNSMADAPVKDFRDEKVDEHPMQGMAIYETQERNSGGKIKNWTKLVEQRGEMSWSFDTGSEDTYNMVAKKDGDGVWHLFFEKVRNGSPVDATSDVATRTNKREARAKAVDIMRQEQSAKRLEGRFPGIGLRDFSSYSRQY
ncbi:MAG: hypothetical protein ABEJ98_03190 [Candidatus Nanohaloarchaea archaeon]